MSIRRNMKPIRFATVIFAATALIGVAQAQSSYSCVNDAPNPYKQVTGWANMPRAWAATNNVFVDGKGLDVFDRPTGIAFAPNGDIFISEGHAPTFGNSRIMKFDKNGKFIKTFGRLGSGNGELRGPHVLAFDSQGRLFVADRSNSRVAIFDRGGEFLSAWKQFGRPNGIFIDKNDMLYVSDSESEDAPGKDTNNPGCKRGIRGGSVKDGKVQFYIPPPPVADSKLPPTEGVAADSHSTIYAAAVQAQDVHQYVRK